MTEKRTVVAQRNSLLVDATDCGFDPHLGRTNYLIFFVLALLKSRRLISQLNKKCFQSQKTENRIS